MNALVLMAAPLFLHNPLQAATNCSAIDVMGVTCTVGLAKRRKGQVQLVR